MHVALKLVSLVWIQRRQHNCSVWKKSNHVSFVCGWHNKIICTKKIIRGIEGERMSERSKWDPNVGGCAINLFITLLFPLGYQVAISITVFEQPVIQLF